MEQPFGRGREAINELIDLLVNIDVPLEIALARRLLRMSSLISQGNSDVTIEEHLLWYLGAGRNFYIALERSTLTKCDLIVDGMLQLMK